jgi:cation transport ATPase
MTTEPNQPQSTDPLNPKPVPPRPPAPQTEPEDNEDKQMQVAMRMVGSAMVFIGFLQVFLSASTGAEITIFPMIIYFGGLAMWAYSSVENATVKYAVMAGSAICALGFMHFGEVLFWHKYIIYWGTIAMVVFFMFKSPPKPTE